jgi:hypothetical protein
MTVHFGYKSGKRKVHVFRLQKREKKIHVFYSLGLPLEVSAFARLQISQGFFSQNGASDVHSTDIPIHDEVEEQGVSWF